MATNRTSLYSASVSKEEVKLSKVNNTKHKYKISLKTRKMQVVKKQVAMHGDFRCPIARS